MIEITAISGKIDDSLVETKAERLARQKKLYFESELSKVYENSEIGKRHIHIFYDAEVVNEMEVFRDTNVPIRFFMDYLVFGHINTFFKDFPQVDRDQVLYPDMFIVRD